MKYIAELKQSGEGCDYTIECGTKVIELKSTNLVDAKLELFGIIKENYSYNERRLEKCILYEVDSIHLIDLNQLYKKFDEIEIELEKRENERSEREQYEKLKQKHETK